MKRKTTITIETDRILMVRRRGIDEQRWCDECNRRSRMMAPDEAAALLDVSTRTIYRWIERGRLHFTESKGSALLVCADSLERQA